MKKIFMVVQNKDVLPALESLRLEGTVHVEHQQKPKGPSIDELREKVKILEKVINILSQCPKIDQCGMDNWQDKAEEILGFDMLIEQLKDGIAKRQSKVNQWEPWGSFSPEDVERLKAKGVIVQFVEIPQADLDTVPDGVVLEEIYRKNGIVRCMVITNEDIELPFTPLRLPSVSVNELNNAQQRDNERIGAAEDRIKQAACYLEGFQNALAAVNEDLAFQETHGGLGEDESLSILKGFCPFDHCEQLEKIAKEKQWGLLVEAPSEDEQVPTLLRNPRWVELINPVFDLINVLPGYKEVDISVIFLFFFSIFFGMLIGDAGYGAVFGLITLYVQIKMGKKAEDKTPFVLMYILSCMAISWGVLTGTYFGQKWVAPYIPALMPWLTDGANVQKVCFFLGALHLSLAHAWRAIIRIPSLTALAELGWSLWMWGMFFFVRQLIVGDPMPPVGLPLIIAGAVLPVLFSSPNKNIFKMILNGFLAFVGSFINAFTDVISYIRLFAVGLATVAIADAFNDIALGVGFSNIFTSFATALILFIGHALNIILAAMAILVHGLRLNVLEFSNHMGIQWAGIKFVPFKKNTN